MKVKSGGGEDFAPIPAGVHQAVCYGLVDVGTHTPRDPKHKPQRKVTLLFELPYERGDFGDRGNLPRAVSTTLTMSIGKKAILGQFLTSWRGRAFTAEEEQGFELKNIIGKNCQLQLVHTPRNGKTYADIENIMPLAKAQGPMPAQQPVKQENPTLYFDLDGKDLKKLVFPPNMPKWIQMKIMQCHEVIEANGGTVGGQDDGQGPGRDEEQNEAARRAHEEEEAAHAANQQAQDTSDTPRYAPSTRQPVKPKAPDTQDNDDSDVPF